MPRNLIFASCYVYSPCGECMNSARSRLRCALLKAGDERFISRCAERVRRLSNEHSLLAGFFNGADILVPVPGSEPCPAGAMSPTDRLAIALVKEGLGQGMWLGLTRLHAVRKSATAPRGHRPSVLEHLDSFGVEHVEALPRSEQIVLVDDVVTKGRTLMAAAMRMREIFPEVRVRGFAMLRTLGTAPEVNRLLDPCVGRIRWRGADVHRAP